VSPAPLYHPVRFAEDCAVLDALSGGRPEMPVAIGYRRREAAGYGVDFAPAGQPHRRVRRALLRRARSGGILSILTPDAAIEMFTAMREQAPVAHYTMMLPPGLPPREFAPYAQVFADEVMPAFG
jgi:hypothetical protein